jgi:DNA-binding transcriptional MerR regulator
MSAELRRPGRTYTIRQLAQEFGCTSRALRFYEDKGLLFPARDGQTRVYSYKDRARLRLIVQCKRVGLALAEIREILDLYNRGDGGEAQAVRSLDACRARIRELEQRRVEIDEAIRALNIGVQRLEKQLAGAS